MNAAPGVHPTEETLIAFGLGKADETTVGLVTKHIESCELCRSRVASLPSDSFIDRILAARTPDSLSFDSISDDMQCASINSVEDASVAEALVNSEQYENIRKLGRGGMGIVYLAKNKLMGRDEVLKVLNKSMLDRPDALGRFLREIQSAAKLQHPNVVAAYSAMQMGDALVFAMEYVPGQDLAQMIWTAAEPLAVASACYCIHQAAQGLQHAYEKGMVHRDIKPSNLILTNVDGTKPLVKILDFGLAKVNSENPIDTSLTGEGRMLGTPDYMAPEQALDATRADIRADIYSLGCTFYYLLTGKPPFKADSLLQLLQHHQSSLAPPLNQTRPDVPAEVAKIVSRMMAKEPRMRHQTPAEVAKALAPFVKRKTQANADSKLSKEVGKSSVSSETLPPGATTKRHSSSTSILFALPKTRAASQVELASAPPKPPVVSSSPANLESTRFEQLDEPPPATARRRKRWWRVAAVGAGLLAVAAGLVVIVLRVETPNGTLVVEINDPAVEAKLRDGKLILSGPDGKDRYTLSPNEHNRKIDAGSYKVRVEGVDGLALDTTEFTLKKDGAVTVRVKAVPNGDTKKLDPDRRAAQYVLSIGGTVRVNGDESDLKSEDPQRDLFPWWPREPRTGRDVRAVDQLPRGAIRLTWVELRNNKKTSDAGFAAFKGCRNLMYLGVSDTNVGDEGLAYLSDCVDLRQINCCFTSVSDIGLAHLDGCKKLAFLGLEGTKVTDKSLIRFKGSKAITHLSLQNTAITDQGLAHLKECENLTSIDLNRTRVTDTGLASLHQCNDLGMLAIVFTGVTTKGKDALKMRFPKCRIITK